MDLRHLTFMDSSGAHLLAREHGAAQSNGHSFAVVAGRVRVQRLLRMLGLDECLNLCSGHRSGH